MTGTIRDAQGGALPGVSLTLRNVESGVVRTAVSEGDGTYRLPGLPPGRYELAAELQGFANDADARTSRSRSASSCSVTSRMALQALQETVTVTGEAPVVETTRSEVASVVTQQQIESLPIANRQPISLALLLPGTSMDMTSVRRAQANIGAGGSANTMNLYHVDGGMNMSNNSGQQHLEVPQSAIREFRVNISQSSAEYGAVGGVVLTATKSGTNRFSGEVFEFFRDKSLNALSQIEKERHDQLGEPKPDYTRHSYGGALGGPIIRDRLHFFAAFEKSSEKATATVNTGQPQFYSALEGSFDQRVQPPVVVPARRFPDQPAAARVRPICHGHGAGALRNLRRLQLGILRRRRALAARFEPGRPHLGDRLADAERGPGAAPALAPG